MISATYQKLPIVTLLQAVSQNNPIINNLTMIKLALGTKKKIVKLDRQDFSTLRNLIRQSFPHAPADYMLSYLDQDKDEISLNSDEDLYIMLSAGLKINNVYIKQSLSQVIEVTDMIEPSFEIYDSHIRKNSAVVEKPSFEIYDSHIRKNSAVVENANEVRDEMKRQINVVEQALGEKLEGEQTIKSIEVQVPIYRSMDIPLQESKEVQKVQQKNEVVHLQLCKQVPAETQVEQREERRAQSEKKIQVVQDQQSQNSESFIISVAESNKIINRVQIDDSILSQKIELLFKKHLEEKEFFKKEQPKKEQIRKEELNMKEIPENKQILETQVKPRTKIFKNDSPKRPNIDSELIYHGVICSNCKDQYGIIGIRYQCIYCEGFNLCEQCESQVVHKHALLKVKLPQQIYKKDEFIDLYKRQIFSNVIPPGHYVPSISKEEADRYITTSKQMVTESMERAHRMIQDLFLKMQMTHKNPYEQNKPLLDKPQETIRQKMDHLMFLFEIDERQAKYFCEIHSHLAKEQLADLWIRKKAEKK